MKPLLPLVALGLIMAGCASLTPDELAECQHQIREHQAVQLRLLKIMNETPANTDTHDLAYLLSRHIGTHKHPYYHETKRECWEAP